MTGRGEAGVETRECLMVNTNAACTLAAGRSDSVASKMARAAYRKVAAEYKKKETGGLKDW